MNQNWKQQLKTLIKTILSPILPYKMVCFLRGQRFRLEIHLADHCNLNCVGCTHFSPLADAKFLDVENYKKDAAQFAKLAGKYVNEVHLLGGEPLLHKEINEIMAITRENFPKSAVIILTNGILLATMPEEFWLACKNTDTAISISPYPINIDVKKICGQATKYGVIVKNNQETYKTTFAKDVHDLKGTQNIKKSFEKCVCKHCNLLYEGKFYICHQPAYIKYFNKAFGTDLQVKNSDYIDIYKINSAKPILKYLRNPIPFCRYCDVKSNEDGIIWRQSKKDISEWV